jgi:hypothetical protein
MLWITLWVRSLFSAILGALNKTIKWYKSRKNKAKNQACSHLKGKIAKAMREDKIKLQAQALPVCKAPIQALKYSKIRSTKHH